MKVQSFIALASFFILQEKVSKIKELVKKVKQKLFTREIIMYLIFGVLTTLVNLITYFTFVNVLNIEENTSNVIAIIIAILFAYFTNSCIVFKVKRDNIKEKVKEFFKFILGRIFTMLFEIVGFFLMFNVFGITDIISKPVITVLVIIMNYFISKYFAFRIKEQRNNGNT